MHIHADATFEDVDYHMGMHVSCVHSVVYLSMTMVGEKNALRLAMKTTLSVLKPATIQAKSVLILSQLQELPPWSTCSVASVYLSMEMEAQTGSILEALFTSGKRVFIPKVSS